MWFPDRLRATLWRCRVIVWIAGLLVPRRERSQWRSVQQSRFYHWCQFLAETGQLTPQQRLHIARACWRLFPEAFWLRFDREGFLDRKRSLLGSPIALLAALAVVAITLLLASGIVGAARRAFSPPVAHADRVVVIALDGKGINGNFSRTRSDTLLELTSIWARSRSAEGLTAFSWGPGTLLLPNRDLPVSTARVGPGFFATVGVKPYLGRTFSSSDAQECPTCVVVLSYPLWQHEFHSDADIVGKTVILNGNHRTVIGVLPPDFRLISPGIALWGLLDPAVLFTNFQRRVGAVAKLAPTATPAGLQLDLTDLTENAGYVHPSSQIQVVTIASQLKRNLYSSIWFLLLGIGCAAFVVVLRLSSNGFGRLPQGATPRVKWLGFFTLKSLLLLAVTAILSWFLVHTITALTMGSTNPLADEYSIWLFIPAAIVALSWSIADQQHRCRSCLQRLELPVEIGRLGSVLLNWSGTEMVCPQGHGVLYMPDSAANSLDSDRWNKLDDSWNELFRTG
jgi:hypothetical protein